MVSSVTNVEVLARETNQYFEIYLYLSLFHYIVVSIIVEDSKSFTCIFFFFYLILLDTNN